MNLYRRQINAGTHVCCSVTAQLDWLVAVC